MTYIIGGVPRSGKTKLTHILLNKYHIPGINTDYLLKSLKLHISDFGINEEMSDQEKSRKFQPFLEDLIRVREGYKDNLVIEGADFLPEYLKLFTKNISLSICFLGYPNISIEKKINEIRNNSSDDREWTNNLSDHELFTKVREFIKYSKFLQKKCKKYKIPFFDVSENYLQTLHKAAAYLVN